MKKAFSIVLIAVVCIIGIFALMNYKNANDTKENSEVDIYLSLIHIYQKHPLLQ